ncbi:MAG: hypothetical protein D6730_10125 [Bacteroidetes bacterium]|nr:MAG: hypothetical protein D6730_10125 [Bacteroidota bacterium]
MKKKMMVWAMTLCMFSFGLELAQACFIICGNTIATCGPGQQCKVKDDGAAIRCGGWFGTTYTCDDIA